MKFPIFSFPALKEKFSSHISSFCSKNRPAIKDFLHYAGVPLLFALSFLAGSAARVIVQHFSPPEAVATSSDCASWGLSFQEEGKRPVGNASIQDLASYNAYFAKDTQEKILYLTFDCGYENGNTPLLLNALKKHNVKATFFVVGNFIRDNGDLIKEMVQEGHIVGNHTLSHPDMSGISSLNDFRKQLEGVENLYMGIILPQLASPFNIFLLKNFFAALPQEVFESAEMDGESMTKFYRPPQGIYSTANLSMAKELGYKTFFWSLAYVDWYQDKQPTREEAFDKLLTRIHPGAIVLLHNTSSTNGQILDELLTKWKEMGYTFGTLNDF